MNKVTQITVSLRLREAKRKELTTIAKRLGNLRKEVWRRYGGVSGADANHRTIRDSWLASNRQFDVPARLWKETLRDVIDDIRMYREAVKVKVRKAIAKRTNDAGERKRLYTALKHDKWADDKYLHRMMRKDYKHGKTNVSNQIVLDTGCYRTFIQNGRAWISMSGLTPRKRINVPLNTDIKPKGTLRLIIRDDWVEVHQAVDASLRSCQPCGTATIGIDKGYSEVFMDSDGTVHGDGLGHILSTESDSLKTKYQHRNRLKVIAEAKPHKAENIYKHNLGKKKLNERKKKHHTNVRDTIFKATHAVIDKAGVIVCEDLTKPIRGKSYGKNQNRRLASWVKGVMAESLTSVSQRRGASLVLVSCAYTSQIDSRYGVLLGTRKGDWFHCFDGVVLDADENAARNILARANDVGIPLFMPYQQIKSVLLERTEQFIRRMGLLIQDTSCRTAQLFLPFYQP